MAKRNGGNTPTEVEARAKARQEGLMADKILKTSLGKGSPEVGSWPSLPGQRIIISVTPEEVSLDPAIERLRTWNGMSVQELGIPELARTMIEEGQQEPCVVRPNTQGDLVLVSGARRRAAVIYNNDNGIKLGGADGSAIDQLLDVVVVEMSEHEALRRALIENVQRADFTAMEMAHNIRYVRETFGWGTDTRGGTAEVAQFLGVSPATVTQTEKLLELPADVQAKVESGELKKETALEVASLPIEEQPEVLGKAQEKADREAAEKEERRRKNEEARKKVVDELAKGKGGQKAPATPSETEGGGEGESAAAEATAPKGAESAPTHSVPPVPPKGRVTGRHVREAAKEVREAKGAADTGKRRAPRMGELIDLLGQYATPDAFNSGYPAVMCELAAAFVAWGRGKLSDGKLKARWEDVSDRVILAKKKAPPVGKRVVTAAPKRAVVKKSAGKKAAKKVSVKKPKGAGGKGKK